MNTERKKGKISINPEVCKGCYLCIEACPNKVIAPSKKLNQKGYYPAEFIGPHQNNKGCQGCAMCAMICPDVAIEVYRE